MQYAFRRSVHEFYRSLRLKTRQLQVTDVQISRPGSGALARGTGTGTIHLTAHHLIYTYSASNTTSADNVAKDEEMWVRNPRHAREVGHI